MMALSDLAAGALAGTLAVLAATAALAIPVKVLVAVTGLAGLAFAALGRRR